MTPRLVARLASAALAACCLMPISVNAQAGAAGEAPAVSPAATRRDAATLSASTTVSTDGNTVSGNGHASGTQLNSDMNASFRYASMPGRARWWQFSAGTAARRQQTVHQFMVLGHYVGGSVGFPLGRVKVRASQSFGYLPSYSLTFSPGAGLDLETLGQVPVSAVDYSVAKNPAYSSSTGLSASTQISARSGLTVSAGIQQTNYVNREEPSLASWNAAARYTYRISRYLGVHAGYGRRDGRYSRDAGVNAVYLDDIDVGADLNRPFFFSFSKNTTLTFSTGSTITGGNNRPRRFSVTGIANLDHALGRTGRVGLAYVRAVRLQQGFAEPVFSDSVSASAQNRLTRRLGLEASATWAFGAVGASGDQNQYRAFTGSGRLSFAASRNSSLFAEYLYYQHGIGAAVQQLATVPRDQARQTGRVGFSVRVPVIQQWVRPSGRS